MKITAEPRSDQWNADDFVSGPRVFTIAGVKVGAAEQKYDIELVEGEGRVWRPPLTVLRLLMAAWGDEADAWKGRRVQLYRDDKVRFGSDAVGGIRVAALSDLPDGKPLKVALTEKRGKRALHTVEPLPDRPAEAARPTRKPPLAVAFDAAGITDPADRLRFASKVLGREITKPADLTPDDTTKVLDELNTLAAGGAA